VLSAGCRANTRPGAAGPLASLDRHFLDSLAVVPLIGECGTLLDAGAGAGFPGIVIAIARPKLRVTCVESIQKKAAFLLTLRREIAPNVEVVANRLATLPDDARFDFAVSRATWEPTEWLEHGAPRVGSAGLLLARTVADAPELTAPRGFLREPPRAYEVAGIRRLLQTFRRA